jgi:hypothetical protein
VTSEPTFIVPGDTAGHANARPGSNRPEALDLSNGSTRMPGEHKTTGMSVPPLHRRRCLRCRGALKRTAPRSYHENCWRMELWERRVD